MKIIKVERHKTNEMIKVIMFFFSIIILSGCSPSAKEADGYGNFEATEIIVSSQSNGELSNFSLQEGQNIKINDKVAFIDTTQLHLKKEQLLAQMEAVKAQSGSVLSQIDVIQEQIHTLNIEKGRIENLLKDNAATQKQMDDVVGQISILKQQIRSIESQNISVVSQAKSLESQIRQVQDQIEKSIVKNPVTGTVLVKYVENGEIVNFGKPLYKIADLEMMQLRVYIGEPQLASVKVGQNVQIAIDDQEALKYYDGSISWISSSAEFTPKTIQTREERVNLVYAVKINVENDGSIKIGMPGEMILNPNSVD